MEFFFPWGSFFRKTGGVITGNVVINGTLQVDGNTTLVNPVVMNNTLQVDGETTHNAPITIIHDSVSFADDHITLQAATVAGTVQCIIMRDNLAIPIFGMCSTTLPSVEFGVLPGTSFNIPSTFFEPDPLINVPLMGEQLGFRRVMMVNSFIYS